jgi:sarcosine oxidase
MRVAVVGAGVVGLSTAYELLRRGCEVVCFEAGEPMAARSTGNSRIFRLAHADAGLVAFAARARTVWSAWEEAASIRLIGDQGLVFTGAAAPAWDAAMAEAGAEHTVLDEPGADLGLPVTEPPGPALVDPAAGVIDVLAVGTFLRERVGSSLRVEPVYRLSPGGDRTTVWSSAGAHEVDRVIVAAGAGGCQLAAQAGIYTASTLAHHARFRFRLRDPEASPPCWIDRSESWRAGFTTYQQQSGAGMWSVGADLGAAEIAWERGKDHVVSRSRELVTRFVGEFLAGVDDEVVDFIYCDFPIGLGDGVHVGTNGPVTAVWGDNLFKHAPAIGEALAEALVNDAEPDIPPPPRR